MNFALGYVVLAHRKLGQLERLLRAIHHPEDAIVVHLDRRLGRPSVEAFAAKLAELAGIEIFSEFHCRWGGYSVTQAILRAYERLLARNTQLRYCSLLSGADYPARPRSALIDHLAASGGKEFVEIWWQGDAGDVPYAFRNRYANHWPYEKLVSSSATRRRSLALQKLLGVDRKLPRGLQPVFGATWMTLSAEALRIVLAGARRPEVAAFFKRTALADEMLPHMLLRQSERWPDVVPRNLHFVATADDGTFPKLLRASDLPAIDRSGAFFCRKIEQGEDGGLCDLLDARIRARP